MILCLNKCYSQLILKTASALCIMVFFFCPNFFFFYKIADRFFPAGPVVKNPPSQCRGYRFDPWAGKVAYAAEQLSPSISTEATCCNY